MTKKTIETIIRALEKAQVRYLIVGGLAAAAHGLVRFTADLDMVLDFTPDNLRRAIDVLSSLGYKPRAPVPLDRFLDEKTRTEWIRDKGLTVFSLWSDRFPMTEIDVFAQCPFDDFTRAYKDALRVEPVPGIEATVVGIEDLIALKRKANRPQDIADIERLRQLVDSDET